MSQIKEYIKKDLKLKPIKSFNNSFVLSYKKLIIGKLSENSGKWHFEYSSEFKDQEKIFPLIGFPDKNREYISKELWPFFESRIPSLKNLKVKSFIDKNNIDTNNKALLLIKFGNKTITNPFILKHI